MNSAGNTGVRTSEQELCTWAAVHMGSMATRSCRQQQGAVQQGSSKELCKRAAAEQCAWGG